jgi:hypothetical protein
VRQRPLFVVSDPLAEAGVEREVLAPVANPRLLQRDDETDAFRHAPDADVLLVFHDVRL